VPAVVSRLLIAHGSPDPRHARSMRRLAAMTEQRDGMATAVAFLDHDEPTVGDALGVVRAGAAAVHTLGLFLSDGYHARVDVAKVLADAGEHLALADHGTLGMGPWLLPALKAALLDVDQRTAEPGSGVVLVGAGSSRPEAREEVVQLAGAWQRQRGGPVRPAFASGPGPTLEEALAMLADAGCSRRAVALLMLAPGVLADRVVTVAAQHGVAVAQPLGESPEIVTRISERTLGVSG
jgi:sirohydrochlorin ferrochelatase